MGVTGFRLKFGLVALVLQTVFAILFAFLVQYDATADPKLPKVGDHNYVPGEATVEETTGLLAAKYPRELLCQE